MGALKKIGALTTEVVANVRRLPHPGSRSVASVGDAEGRIEILLVPEKPLRAAARPPTLLSKPLQVAEPRLLRIAEPLVVVRKRATWDEHSEVLRAMSWAQTAGRTRGNDPSVVRKRVGHDRYCSLCSLDVPQELRTKLEEKRVPCFGSTKGNRASLAPSLYVWPTANRKQNSSKIAACIFMRFR